MRCHRLLLETQRGDKGGADTMLSASFKERQNDEQKTSLRLKYIEEEIFLYYANYVQQKKADLSAAGLHATPS